ncbi:3'-5' exonuclease [Lacibacterium aquatile]|uniref:3'-5' exonuclease n=1 Tax=Lacibacterium aquatile TaxID=1168082 RepID=A0ABW5DYS5_9PROT
MRRMWCGPHDPDPVVAQIGAVRLGLEGDYPLLGSYRAFIPPVDRFGERYPLDPYFTNLTGITEADIQTEGVPLEKALADLDTFAEGGDFWSWGKDELNMLAISCYALGIQPPIPARRFDNAAKLLLASGMPLEDLATVNSGRLADYHGIDHPPLRGHDALDDALSIAYTLQHLLRVGKLEAQAFHRS